MALSANSALGITAPASDLGEATVKAAIAGLSLGETGTLTGETFTVALADTFRALYPFCRLTGPANVLVMPGLHSAHITSRLAPRLGQGSTIGPLLIGMQYPAQIVAMDASVSQIVDVACLAAHQTAR